MISISDGSRTTIQLVTVGGEEEAVVLHFRGLTLRVSIWADGTFQIHDKGAVTEHTFQEVHEEGENLV